MLESIMEFLAGKPFYEGGANIWKFLMNSFVKDGLTMNFSSGPMWDAASRLMMLFTGVGAILLNIFFLISIFKECSDFRNNLTAEIFFAYFVKVILGNAFLVNLNNIIRWFMDLGRTVVTAVMGITGTEEFGFIDVDWDVALQDVEATEIIFLLIIGFVFLIGCGVCAILIIWTIYSTYFKVYFYMIISPIALSTVSGTQGISASAVAWVKTFACATLELAGISIVLGLSSTLTTQIAQMAMPEETAFYIAISALLSIIIVAGSVKVTDSLIRRGFGI